MAKNHIEYQFDFHFFADGIKTARRGRGLSQAALGDAIGKSKSTISRYEKMSRLPPLWDFLAICFFLNFDPMTFLLITEAAKETARIFDARVAFAEPRHEFIQDAVNRPKGANGD